MFPFQRSSGSGLVCQEYFGNTPRPGWVTPQPTPTRYTTTPTKHPTPGFSGEGNEHESGHSGDNAA